MLLAAMAAAAVAGFVVAPRVLFWVSGLPSPNRSAWLPWVSVALWAVSWHLPHLPLPSTDTFTQHAVGGGAACAVLARYLSDNLPLRPVVLRLGLAFVVSSVLGVLNELGELGADVLLGYELTGDASWDLLANTLGAAATALAIEALWPWRAAPDRQPERSPAQYGVEG
jgi:hypothetical protein